MNSIYHNLFCFKAFFRLFSNAIILFLFRTVMGAKGSKVQKITTDFNVQIKFPDKAVENGGQEEVNGEGRSTNPNIIKITGKKDNCEGASKALLELVPITAEVSVPFEFHR